jgi:hypothetical protein
MTPGKIGGFGFILLLVGSQASGSLVYTCDNTVDATAAGTCAYLNGTIAGLYNNTFSNVTANIYVEQGITNLGESDTAVDFLPFSQYLSVLTNSSSGNAVDSGAIAALNSLDKLVYGNDSVVITSALAGALGFSGASGLTASDELCTIGDSGCYAGIITVTTPANLPPGQSLYYRQIGGSQANAYDYYSIVEHETDEVLGTISCMETSTTLSDACDGIVGANPGTGTPSAIDLFRYNSVGNLALNNAYLGLGQSPGPPGAPAGAYFSWNGGATNGANGAVFNTLANGDDYADFATPACSHVQDARGCFGHSFDITTDGNAEINMLDAVGYNLATPEPGTIILLGVGLLCIGAINRRAGKKTA